MQYRIIEKPECITQRRKSVIKSGNFNLIDKTFKGKKSLYNELFLHLFFFGNTTQLESAETYFDIFQIDKDGSKTDFHPTNEEFLMLERESTTKKECYERKHGAV